jgi:AmmeMemoRadiSam system protein B
MSFKVSSSNFWIGSILCIALIQMGCAVSLSKFDELTMATNSSEQVAPTTTNTLDFDEIVLPASEYMQLLRTFSKAQSNELVPFPLPIEIEEFRELGVIVPHHLVASDALSSLFSAIKSFEPEIIVLLSPNHQATIKNPVSSRLEHIHVFNKTYTLSPLILKLAQKKLLALNRELFKVEHGIYSILPFIGENDWDVPIIPLVMARNVTRVQVDDLILELRENLKDMRILWIASIDFSHYLPAAAATLKDHQTMEWISTRDFSAIENSTSDHLDAPSALIFWLKLFTNDHQLWHSNSAEILGGGYHEPGTSYMIYIGY